MYFYCSISFTVNLYFTLGWNEFTYDGIFQWTPGCGRYIITTCSLKPYNIKGKSYTINAVDRTAVLLPVMITQTISGFALKWKM